MGEGDGAEEGPVVGDAVEEEVEGAFFGADGFVAEGALGLDGDEVVASFVHGEGREAVEGGRGAELEDVRGEGVGAAMGLAAAERNETGLEVRLGDEPALEGELAAEALLGNVHAAPPEPRPLASAQAPCCAAPRSRRPVTMIGHRGRIVNRDRRPSTAPPA